MLFQIILFGFEVVLGQQLQTPTFFNFNEHISTFITSKNESDIQSTHNCLIVPCTAFGRPQNCMVITKLTFGGDCFTRPIQSSLNFTSEEDVATLEFAYYASSHPSSKSPNTGIVIGWTNDEDEFYWIAAEDISVITSGVQMNYNNAGLQIKQINMHNLLLLTVSLRTLGQKVHIRPNSTKPFRIVFEAYSDATDFAGKFLVTNISVFDRSTCSEGCSTCLSYTECTSCEKGRLYRGACISDYCYYDAGSITANKISVGWISEQNSLYGIVLKNIKINECHQVKFTMNKINSNYIDGSNSGLDIYQYGFKIQQSTLSSAGCLYQLILPISGKPGYSCLFEFLLQLKNTTVDLVNMTWTQEFYYQTNNSEILVTGEISSNQVEFQVLTSSIYLGEASTKVEGKQFKPNLLYIIYVIQRQYYFIMLTTKKQDIMDQHQNIGLSTVCESSTCRSFYTEPQVLYLNDPFYILVMLDNKYIDFGADFKFQLVSAIALGNGTYINLKSQDESEKNMTAIIYKFTVPFAVQNCTIQLTAQLIERDVDDNAVTDSRRRMLLRRLLQTDNQTTSNANSGYTVSGSIKVESIEILPYWKVYPKDAPYIIIGVSAGLVVTAIILYCACLTFSQKQVHSQRESKYNVSNMYVIDNPEEQNTIKEMFRNIN